MDYSGTKKLNEAQAAYYNALAAKAEQDGASRGRDGAPQFSLNPVDTGPDVVYGPPEFVRPQVEVSKAPGVVAGTYPAFKDVMDSKGRVHRVPNPDLFDDPSNPGAIEFFRSVSKWNTTDRIEDIVNWVKSWSSPLRS